MCIVSCVCLLAHVDYFFQPFSYLIFYYLSSVCLWHAVFCLCIQDQSSKQFIMCSLQSDSSSTTMSANHFFPVLWFSSPAGWPAVALYSHRLPLLPYLFSFMFVTFHPVMYLLFLKLFNSVIIRCIWSYLTTFHLYTGQQPEGGQCAQIVDHRGTRASSQETLLLRALSGRHAVCTHH